MEKEKRYIPGTSSDWNLELPDGDANSLVTKDGKNWDNGYNFDERIDDEPEAKTTFENITEGQEFNPEAAEEARKQAADRETE